jgi:hypothetical protein
VNTTPKPNATKKSSGELVGPFEPLEDVVDTVGLALVDAVKPGNRVEVGVVVCVLCECAS